ncbi:BZ3500_MvSof-1268-A1-R1_Chr10-2g02792 [Microbotryum saponariae]|uniref:BZ3500_MvSof-1268-A1-R1_Chr10-2g02792 protein n=1 Tax=Microbotryum saponariae TaxID=289078 RepID=A0A2X0N3C1_9BASI|nr:BZ3500_MvSof-1268-A1-R1_Chr10-2g02792 [Microbotryum saponariae]
MRRKLRNGKGARAGICPGAGEIAGALRQSRAAKSPLQGRASGARPKTAGAGALRHSRAPKVDSSHIRQWPIPCNKTDVQRFLGTVNWMRDHLPHLSKILEPITALMAQATSWRWNEREQQAFDTIKSLVPAILRPIDGAKVTSGEHKMYLFTDASRVGIGACLASGPNRSQAVPTRFFSAKFNGAQLNYHVTD